MRSVVVRIRIVRFLKIVGAAIACFRDAFPSGVDVVKAAAEQVEVVDSREHCWFAQFVSPCTWAPSTWTRSSF